MAKEIKQSLKVSTDVLLDEDANISTKLEGIANLKSVSRVFSRRTNNVHGITPEIVKSVDYEDRVFLKDYEENGKAMIEKTVIDAGITMSRIFTKDLQVYIDAGKIFVPRSVSTDSFVYCGTSQDGNPMFELIHLDISNPMYHKSKSNPTPVKAVSTLLKPRINREDVEKYINDPTVELPDSLKNLISGETVRKRTTRIVKKVAKK